MENRQHRKPLTVGKILWIEYGVCVAAKVIAIFTGLSFLDIINVVAGFSLPLTLGYFWSSPRMDAGSRGLAKAIWFILALIGVVLIAGTMVPTTSSFHATSIDIRGLAAALTVLAAGMFVPFYAGKLAWARMRGTR